MRHFKRICFFCYSCALFAGGFWCSLEMEAFFYPGRGASPKAYESSGFLPAAPDLTSGKEAERASSSSAVKKESGGQKDPAFCLIVEDNRVNAYGCRRADAALPAQEADLKRLWPGFRRQSGKISCFICRSVI